MREGYRFLGDSQPNFQRTAIIKISLPASLLSLPKKKKLTSACGIYIYTNPQTFRGNHYQVECTILLTTDIE